MTKKDLYAYTTTTSTYHESYSRNSKAVGVLWGTFTICFLIINILVFLQPYWIGSVPEESQKAGIFGLYQHCITEDEVEAYLNTDNCDGSVSEFNEILSTPFKIATATVGASAFITVLSVACMLLFFFVKSRYVFLLCGFLQLAAFVCLLVGCVVFPIGWDASLVRSVCGPEAEAFALGTCELRWTYILAIIACVDAFFLCTLAFTLAAVQVRKLPAYTVRDTSYGTGTALRPPVDLANYDGMSQFSAHGTVASHIRP